MIPEVMQSAIVAIWACVLCMPLALATQHVKSNEQKEQSNFGIELDLVPIQRPAELSRAALRVLSKDERVASCLKHDDLSAEELPADWFVASEIHLGGPNEVDLVVLPGGRLPDTPPGEISQNVCLMGANTAQMWVLRDTQAGFQLVLSQIGLGMSVLSTRTNGLRDIQVGFAVGGGGYDVEIEDKFDGKSYEITERTSTLTSAKLPATLSGYETRKSFIQSAGQDAETVRAEARLWIWRAWEKRQRSYIHVRTHDDRTDETTSYFVAPNEDGEWEVTMDVNRIERPAESSSSQRSITEKDLFVAIEVQRVEPTVDDSHLPRVIPQDKAVAESEYRLEFSDYRKLIIATL